MLQDSNSPHIYNPQYPDGRSQAPSGMYQSYRHAKPSRRKKPLLLFLGIGGALALIITLASLALLIPLKILLDQAHTAGALLNSAATYLSRDPAAHYVGTITDTSGSAIQADLQVTNQGSTYGTLIQQNEHIEVLVIEHMTFLKADQSFWRTQGVSANLLSVYAGQWVEVSTNTMGIDFQTLLAPITLGQQIRQASQSPFITLGPQMAINGVQARQVNTSQNTLYVTTIAPQRIVRIKATATSPLAHTSQGIARILPDQFQMAHANSDKIIYQFDISPLSISEAKNLLGQIQEKLVNLRNSINAEVRFTLQGQAILAPCTSSACTATLTISNSVDSSDSGENSQIPVSITINVTLDGTPVQTCSETETMPPNGTTTAQCTATYSITSSSTSTTHLVVATWSAIAQAMSSANIHQVSENLNQELQQWDSEESAVIAEINAASSTRRQFTESSLLDWISRVGGRMITPDSSGRLGNLARDNGRIYLGNYDEQGIISNGQEIRVASNLPGLQTLEGWAFEYGGKTLSDIQKPPIFAQLQAAINTANSIVFNIGRNGFQTGGLTAQEFRYILSVPGLLQKTIFVFGATW